MARSLLVGLLLARRPDLSLQEAVAGAPPSLAVCMTGSVNGALQRPMVHRSVLNNLIGGLQAGQVDIFAQVEVTTPAEASVVEDVLSRGLQARSVVVRVPEESWAPTCRIAQEQRPVARMWEDIESCFTQVEAAEQNTGKRYDWVLRVRPDIMWHTPASGIASFNPSVVSRAHRADDVFLSPRAYADAAFRGALDEYKKCSTGTVAFHSDGTGDLLDALESRGVQHARRSFGNVLLPNSGTTEELNSNCKAAVQDGFDEDLCMRLLTSKKPDPVMSVVATVQSDDECMGQRPETTEPQMKQVLIATPVRNAANQITRFVAALQKLSYPRNLISVAFLVGESKDDTRSSLQNLAKTELADFRSVAVLDEDHKADAISFERRHNLNVQAKRRSALAASRNELLQKAMTEDTFAVLWLDVDIIGFPATLVQDLLAVGQPVVAPHVLIGKETYDRNSWKENEPEDAFAEAGVQEVMFEAYGMRSAGARDHFDVLKTMASAMGAKDKKYAVRLDGVGTAALLVEARVHRDAKINFPETPYKHRLESEGFGLWAGDRGFKVCGLPFYEVQHDLTGEMSRRLEGNTTHNTTTTSELITTTTPELITTTTQEVEETTTTAAVTTTSVADQGEVRATVVSMEVVLEMSKSAGELNEDDNFKTAIRRVFSEVSGLSMSFIEPTFRDDAETGDVVMEIVITVPDDSSYAGATLDSAPDAIRAVNEAAATQQIADELVAMGLSSEYDVTVTSISDTTVTRLGDDDDIEPSKASPLTTTMASTFALIALATSLF